MIEHKQVLHTDLINNSEIRYKKLCIFPIGGAYAPYALCLSMPLITRLYSRLIYYTT